MSCSETGNVLYLVTHKKKLPPNFEKHLFISMISRFSFSFDSKRLLNLFRFRFCVIDIVKKMTPTKDVPEVRDTQKQNKQSHAFAE